MEWVLGSAVKYVACLRNTYVQSQNAITVRVGQHTPFFPGSVHLSKTAALDMVGTYVYFWF
jgi:hypothetical protein